MPPKKKDGPAAPVLATAPTEPMWAPPEVPVVADASQALYKDHSGPARQQAVTEGSGYRDTMAALAREAAAAGAHQLEDT